MNVLEKNYSILTKIKNEKIYIYNGGNHFERLNLKNIEKNIYALLVNIICLQEQLMFFSDFKFDVPEVKFKLYFYGTSDILSNYLQLYIKNRFAIFDLAKMSAKIDKNNLMIIPPYAKQFDFSYIPKKFKRNTFSPVFKNNISVESLSSIFGDKQNIDFKLEPFPKLEDKIYFDLFSHFKKLLCLFEGKMIYQNGPINITLQYDYYKSPAYLYILMTINNFVIFRAYFNSEKFLHCEPIMDNLNFFLNFLYRHNLYNDFIVKLQENILKKKVK